MSADTALTADEVGELREATPGCAGPAFFDHAGASLQPAAVHRAVLDYCSDELELGGYAAAAHWQSRLEAVRASAAELIGAGCDEVALTSGATDAWYRAFLALPLGSASRILVHGLEYGSNLLGVLSARQRLGCATHRLADVEDGTLDLDSLEHELRAGAGLVLLTWVPSGSGARNPAAAAGRLCRAYGTTCILDACQAAGQIPIDVGALGCDFLVATGRKFLRGPRGTGFLYARRETTAALAPPMPDLRSARFTGPDSFEYAEAARRFEHFEASYSGRVGLGVAIDCLLAIGPERAWRRIRGLAERLRSRLLRTGGVEVHDAGAPVSAIVTFTVAGETPARTQARLLGHGIRIGTCTAQSTWLHASSRRRADAARASVHYFNTEQEIDALVDAVTAAG